MTKISYLNKNDIQNKLDNYTPTNSYLSEGMIERSLWGFGGVTSLIGATAFAWGFPLGSVALTACSVICLYNAYLTRNYNSSTEVAKYQKECKSQSLQQAVDNHGKYVFLRKLLTPEEVEEKYLAIESTLQNIPSICAFYTKIESLRKLGDPENHYSLPVPIRLKEKFQKICSFLSFDQIQNTHSLEIIFSWKLLSKEAFFSKYKDYQDLLFRKNGITAVINHYKKSEEAQKKHANNDYYTIPHPKDLTSIWYESLQEMSVDSLPNKTSLEELINYGVIKEIKDIEKLRAIIENLDSVKTGYYTQLKAIEDSYEKTITDADSLLNREKCTIRIAKEALNRTKLEIRSTINYIEEQIRWAKERKDPVLVARLEKDLLQARNSESFHTIFNTSFRERNLEYDLEKAIRKNAETRTQAENKKKCAIQDLKKEYDSNLSKIQQKFNKLKKHLHQH